MAAVLVALLGAGVPLPAPGLFVFVYIAVIVVEIAALWQVFGKAGRPGWAAIIPFYNYYVLLKVVGRPGWWLIIYFIPIVDIVLWIIVALDLAKSFRQSTGFGVGIIFLPFIFIPIIGFGAAEYGGPAAGGPRAVPVY